MIKTVQGEVIERNSKSTATIVIMADEEHFTLKHFGGCALRVPFKDVIEGLQKDIARNSNGNAVNCEENHRTPQKG